MSYPVLALWRPLVAGWGALKSWPTQWPLEVVDSGYFPSSSMAGGRGEDAGKVNLRYGAELGVLPITSDKRVIH